MKVAALWIILALVVAGCALGILFLNLNQESLSPGELHDLDVLRARISFNLRDGEAVPSNWVDMEKSINLQSEPSDQGYFHIERVSGRYTVLAAPSQLLDESGIKSVVVIRSEQIGSKSKKGRWALVVSSNMVYREFIREEWLTEEIKSQIDTTENEGR